MLAALEGGGGADLVGGTGARGDEADVVIAVVDDLVHAVVQEVDADGALAGADRLGRATAGLGVLGDVLVEVDQILDALIVAVLLDDRVEDQLSGGGGVVVGRPDQALVAGVEQVGPVRGSLEAELLELLHVVEEAEDAEVDAHPGAIGGGEVLVGDGGEVCGRVLHEQAIVGSLDVGGAAAAEPHVGRRIAVLLLGLGENLAAAEALEAGLDAEELGVLVARRDDVGLLAGADDDELALGLSCCNELRVIALDAGSVAAATLAAAAVAAATTAAVQAEAGEDTGRRKEVPTRKCLAHTTSPFP